MLIVRRHEVERILAGRERDIIDLVASAYRRHDEGRTVVPHSTFLRLPPGPGETGTRNRIIGLPAYLGGTEPVAGFKWIASFPGNIKRGIERASAVIVTNSLETGQPDAFIEASIISAARTAASAALATKLLAPDAESTGAALIGCGVINMTYLRHLLVVRPDLAGLTLYDVDPDRAAEFAARCAVMVPHLKVDIATSPGDAVAAHPLICVATTATSPHLDLDGCPPRSVVLHLSLRDLLPHTIVDSSNVVDDADHVCREQTSLHLAEQMSGGRDFITASLGSLLRGTPLPPREPDRPVVFSPFGLGVLDLAVARFVRDRARQCGDGVQIDDFLHS